MENKEVAAIFLELSELLEIEGGDRYRARAFKRAANVIEALADPVEEALKFTALEKRRGIGEGTTRRVKEILRTGTLRDLQLLRARVPTSARELLQIEGIGPKSVRILYTRLGITSVEALEAAALTGRLERLPRFGSSTCERILESIEDYRRRVDKTPLPEALRIGEMLRDAIRVHPAVALVELAGSARRRKEMVGDFDVLVATQERGRVSDACCSLPGVVGIRRRGEGRVTVRLEAGGGADFRIIDPETFGAGLHTLTGSKRHNIAIRVLGNKRGLKISEHGVLTRREERRLAGAFEVDVFSALGLPFIAPELREDDGELQAARRGALPRLVEEGELKGDLSIRTRQSDGHAALRAMVEAARDRGLRYLAVTDHSIGAGRGRGLDGAALLRQAARIRKLNREWDGPRLLAGIEVEILPDGQLALEPELLATLDWVSAGVHSELDQGREEMTARVLRALESGVVDCLAHPTGRRLGARGPLRLDLERVMLAALRLGVALEVSGRPSRLDLDAASCRRARELGVPLVASSGAHAPAELADLRFALYTARRGWLEARDLLNAGPLERVLEHRARRLRRGARVAPAARLEADGRSAIDAESGRLGRELEAAVLPAWLRDRLERFLRTGEDAPLAAALGAENPVRAAFAQLLHSRRRPQASIREP